MRPIVGIIGNHYLVDGEYPVRAAGTMNLDAISQVSGCVPMIIPPNPNYASVEELLNCCDGLLLTGGRPNVHPSHYGHDETPAHGTFDQDRDEVVLPLVRACVQKGQPILGICRGFQEINVAFGGSLHPEIRDLEDRDNHRMPPDGTIDEKFALRHEVEFTVGGPFHRLFSETTVMTNTLHGQGIEAAGDRVVVDGHAPDGTPEAIYIADAPGFALGVQWHPEYRASDDPISRVLFEAFGRAAKAWAEGVAVAEVSA